MSSFATRDDRDHSEEKEWQKFVELFTHKGGDEEKTGALYSVEQGRRSK